MPDNIARLIEVEDDRVEGIKKLFDYLGKEIEDSTDSLVQDAKGEVERIVPPATGRINVSPHIKVEKGDIFVLGNPSALNVRSYIYANIGGESICVGETDSYHYDNGKQMGVFTGKTGTKLEGEKQKFEARTVDERDDDFRKWILGILAKKYPNDYESQKEEVISYEGITEGGIIFKYESISGEGHFSFSIEYKGKKITGIPIVDRKSGKYLVKLVAKNKRGIAGNQFEKLVTGKDSNLLASVGKMIDEFVKVLEGNHSGIKKNWNVEDFQAIASSFQSSDL